MVVKADDAAQASAYQRKAVKARQLDRAPSYTARAQMKERLGNNNEDNTRCTRGRSRLTLRR